MDEAFEQREHEGVSQAFKIVPTPSDWMNAGWHAKSNHLIKCPVCHCAVVDSAVDEHTTWHRQIADIFALLAG